MRSDWGLESVHLARSSTQDSEMLDDLNPHPDNYHPLEFSRRGYPIRGGPPMNHTHAPPHEHDREKKRMGAAGAEHSHSILPGAKT